MTRTELLQFLRQHRLLVEATTGPNGAPQAAVVGYAVSDAFEFVFDTLESSRKYHNLRRDSRVALVVGWDGEATAQIEGKADFPEGHELDRIRECYFGAYPDGRERLATWQGLCHVRVRPHWIRYSDFSPNPARIVEFTASQLEPR